MNLKINQVFDFFFFCIYLKKQNNRFEINNIHKIKKTFKCYVHKFVNLLIFD